MLIQIYWFLIYNGSPSFLSQGHRAASFQQASEIENFLSFSLSRDFPFHMNKLKVLCEGKAFEDIFAPLHVLLNSWVSRRAGIKLKSGSFSLDYQGFDKSFEGFCLKNVFFCLFNQRRLYEEIEIAFIFGFVWWIVRIIFPFSHSPSYLRSHWFQSSSAHSCLWKSYSLKTLLDF